MLESLDGEVSTEWSYALFTHLHRFGVEHIVISPGSRSTPLVLGASLIEGLKKHVILDERSAAFFALGIGKSTGKPAILICTSGTAAANYFPAVIEASQSYAPLIVISADRPISMVDRHAPQTINQKHLFGNYALTYKDSEALRTLGANAKETFNLAKNLFLETYLNRGPVHLNAPFPKPLEPKPEAYKTLTSRIDVPCFDYSIGKKDIDHTLKSVIRQVIKRLESSERPVIIAGPASVLDGAESLFLHFLLQNTDIPILSEGTSGIRLPHGDNPLVITGYETYLRSISIRKELQPDFILRIGLPPISIALNRYLMEHKEIEQWAVSHARQIPDPDYTVDQFLKLPHFSDYIPDSFTIKASESWIQKWIHHEADAFSLPAITSHKYHELTDADVTLALLEVIKDDECLFVSNSLSVRDADLMQMNGAKRVTVFHNRGASGIDGVTSTAAGVAIATDKTTWLLTGDLAFLHDTTALMTLKKMSGRLNIVILNNGGGTIFRMLPVYALEEVYKTYFETPQTVNIGLICEGFGIKHHRIEHKHDLTQHLSELSELNHVTIIECVTNADASLQIRHKLWKHYAD
jgi:2-succinyl-5-enolpyruvyl-6-hydroxy-3-cyclohexene-1-carboxylate synthase